MGKKFIWSNCIQSRGHHHHYQHDAYVIPGYDLYNAGFGMCDKLNRFVNNILTFKHNRRRRSSCRVVFAAAVFLHLSNQKFSFHHRSLRQRNFPYRCGPAAQSSGSDLKRYFDFILSSVLHNTFEIFEQQVNDLQQQQRNVSEEDSQKQ